MIPYKYTVLAVVLFLTVSCYQKPHHGSGVLSEHSLPKGLPEDLWLSEPVVKSLDSLFTLSSQAHQKLGEKDTLGAELFFEYAFGIMTRFSEEENATLENWPAYDSLLAVMNTDYERILDTKEIDIEAEEIREDIMALEEERTFPDSVLFGDGVAIDSSTGFPITLNYKVRLAIKYFQTKGRGVFTRWLERQGLYEDLIRQTLHKYGLPEELMYLPMIESGFNPNAYSYARAAGMWQFISSTGSFYGLRSDWWYDERRDVVKSTEAGIKHLRDLYEQFDDWYLALAGYNCSPNKIKRNMRKYNTRDFWKLKTLPRQTRNYVPTFLAATIIANNPKKFGFYVDKRQSLKVDSVHISESVDLNVIAKLVDTTYAYIKEINPAVLRWVTPSGVKAFALYLPEGKKELFKQRYSEIPEQEKRSWVRHNIRSGETLSTIARKYHTTVSVIKSTNNLHNNLIRAGHYLLIPVPQNKAHFYIAESKPAPSVSRKKPQKAVTVTSVPGHKSVSYIVKQGDTIGEIAEAFHTRASKIRAWNGLRYGQYIYPNQKLTIWVPNTMEDLAEKNDDFSSDSAPISAEGLNFYTVKRGDTLWDIAQKYKVSVSQLKQWNNMSGSRIKPGDRIKISD